MIRSCLTALLAAVMALPAAAQDDLLAAVAQARQHCNASAPALRPNAQLDAAAAQLLQGGTLEAALQASGYRATRSFQIALGGHPNAQVVGQALTAQCQVLANPELREIGVQRRGTQWRIVAAVPFDPPAAAQSADVAAQVLALVNQARSQPRHCGAQSFGAAPALVLNPQLTQAAQAHAESMARYGYLEHQGRDGSRPQDRIDRTGYRWRSVGENIASGQATPEHVVRDWLKSPEHCANVMEAKFTEMGLAYAVNKATEGGIYWAQTFGRR